MKRIARVGIGGPVGAGKTALIEALVPYLSKKGWEILVVTNDIVTREDEQHVRKTLADFLEPDRIIGVETGTCPHTAVREDPSLNLFALDQLETRFPQADMILLESGGDNLTLTFSPALVDATIFVLDVAGGDKVPRKRGPGVMTADLLVINKIDLAPYVRADLDVMAKDSQMVREGRPFIFTNCFDGTGIADVGEWIIAQVLATEAVDG